jgi:hypothetical protein
VDSDLRSESGCLAGWDPLRERSESILSSSSRKYDESKKVDRGRSLRAPALKMLVADLGYGSE